MLSAPTSELIDKFVQVDVQASSVFMLSKRPVVWTTNYDKTYVVSSSSLLKNHQQLIKSRHHHSREENYPS
jgi:hypothetical protein